jgi:hypothetical protein
MLLQLMRLVQLQVIKEYNMAYDPNQAHPKIDYKGTYPNLWVTQRPDGSSERRSLDPGNETVFETEASGNYTAHGPDGALVIATVGKQHSYNADGTSQTTDGHADEKVGGTKRETTDGGTHEETGGNKYEGGGGVKLSGSHDSEINHSNGDGWNNTEGNIVKNHDGDTHHSIVGNNIEQTTGHRVTIVNGEKGISVVGGNMDTKVAGGKYQVKAAKAITIDSDTSITLQVGQSYIQIFPNGIEIGTDGFINVFVNKGNQNLSIINYGTGRSQMGTDGGEVTLAGNSIVLKSKTGTTIEKGPAIPPLPWGGVKK